MTDQSIPPDASEIQRPTPGAAERSRERKIGELIGIAARALEEGYGWIRSERPQLEALVATFDDAVLDHLVDEVSPDDVAQTLARWMWFDLQRDAKAAERRARARSFASYGPLRARVAELLRASSIAFPFEIIELGRRRSVSLDTFADELVGDYPWLDLIVVPAQLERAAAEITRIASILTRGSAMERWTTGPQFDGDEDEDSLLLADLDPELIGPLHEPARMPANRDRWGKLKAPKRKRR